MPPRNTDPVDAAIDELARQIGEQLATAISAAFTEALEVGAATGQPSAGVAVGARASCKVPDCTRPSAARGLCQNHYAKAKRLKLALDGLSENDLQTLAADLRGQRGR